MSRLDDLDDAIKNFEDEDDFKVYKADYEETDAFKVTTENGAIPGNYAIEVKSLATTEAEVSQGFDDKSSTGVLQEGSLVVTYGGTDTTITIDSDNSSLTKLAAAIDDIDGLSAYVLDTGADDEPYKLVVQSEDTGSDNTIEFDTSGLSGSGTAISFTEQRRRGRCGDRDQRHLGDRLRQHVRQCHSRNGYRDLSDEHQRRERHGESGQGSD